MGKSIEANMINQARTLFATAKSGLYYTNPLIKRTSDLLSYVVKFHQTDSLVCTRRLQEMETLVYHALKAKELQDLESQREYEQAIKVRPPRVG